MKTLMQWLRLHPIKAVLFTMILTALATAAGFREDLFNQLRALFILFAGIWYVIALWDTKRVSKSNGSGIGPKLMSLLLAGLFSCIQSNADEIPAPPQGEQIKAVPVAVGCVVICVGGYCVYKVAKFCQRKFPPKDTNAPPQEVSLSEDEYGGAYEYSSIGSCYIPPALNAFPYEDLFHNPTTFTLNVSVLGGSIRTSMKANNDEGTTQTWDQFAAEMAEHGLFLTGRASWQPQFERNGIPCDASSVPLEFDPTTGRVTHNTGGELRRVLIERSANLQDWYPLMMTDVSDGTGFKVVDTTREGQMFYRLSVKEMNE